MDDGVDDDTDDYTDDDRDDDTDNDNDHKNDSYTAAGAAPGASVPCSFYRVPVVHGDLTPEAINQTFGKHFQTRSKTQSKPAPRGTFRTSPKLPMNFF